MADNYMTFNDAVEVLTPYAEKINTIKPESITWAAYQLLTSEQKAAKRYLITDYPSPTGYVNKLSDLEDVSINSQTLSNGQVPVYNSTNEVWENKTILENSLTSTATDVALTAAQGKVLQDTKQPKTLATPLTINGQTESTVEGALGGLNDYGDALKDNLAANENVYGAKNLNSYPYYDTTKSSSGVTFTDNGNGTITATGTAGASMLFAFHLRNDDKAKLLLNKGTYKLNGCPSGGSLSTYYLRAGITKDGNFHEVGVDTGNGCEFTIENDNTQINLTIETISGTVYGVDGLTFKPMIYDSRILDDTFVPFAKTNLQLTNDKAEKSQLSNENLLDNPFFTVNQRGVTSGTANNVYTVDRWAADYGTTAGTWSLTSSGMTLSPNLNDYVFIKQKLENAGELVGKVITLSAELSDGTIYSYTFTRASGQNQNRDFDNATIRLNFNRLDYVGVVIRRNTADDPLSRTIRAVKLERGTVSTLANDVAPNYTTELLKCQRYFKVALNDIWNVGIAIATATDTIEFYYFSDVPMRVTPSVSTAGAITAIKIADGSEVAISSVEISLDIDAKNGRIDFKTSTTLTIRDLYILKMNNAKVMLSSDL